MYGTIRLHTLTNPSCPPHPNGISEFNEGVVIEHIYRMQVGTSQKTKGADYALESIHNIREALPELWEADNKKIPEVSYNGKVAVETFVTA